jgi:hypothetical protein
MSNQLIPFWQRLRFGLLAAVLLPFTVVAPLQGQLTEMTGLVKAEFYTDIEGSSVINDLWSSAKFPDNPDVTLFLGSLETPRNWGENYGVRVSGWFVPPQTGNYVFYLASNHAGEFMLSPDHTESGATWICDDFGAERFRDWTGTDPLWNERDPGAPENRSDTNPNNWWKPITLQAGQGYYFQAIMKAPDTTYDHLGVTFKLEDEPDPVPGSPSRMTGNVIRTMGDPNSVLPVIVGHPQGQEVTEGESVTLTVEVSVHSTPPLTYQWRLDGEDIPNATQASYTIPSFQAQDAGRYSVVVSNDIGQATSLAAFVRRQADSIIDVPSEGLVLHLDAASIDLTDGAPVGVWPDLSGHSHDAVQELTERQPKFVRSGSPSGLPVIRFEGTPIPFFETAAMGPYDPPNTVFLVWNLNASTGDGQNVLDGLTAGNRVRIGWSVWSPVVNTIFAYADEGSFNDTVLGAAPPAFPFEAPIVTTVVYDTEGGMLRFDGTIMDEKPTGGLALTGYTIGRRFGFDQQRFIGDVAELLVYSRRLTEAEIEQVEQALISKWLAPIMTVGIVSPAPNTVFTAPATITFVAEAETVDPDGDIVEVEFFAGDVFLGSVTERPFRLTVSGVVAGFYSVRARAIDDLGNSLDSEPVAFVVNPDQVDEYDQEVLRDNPVAHWRFEETSGTIAADETGRHNASIFNNPDLNVDGRVGSAIRMIGANETYAEAPNHEDLNITGSLTLECWVNIGDGWTTDAEMLIGKGDDAYQLRRSSSSPNIRFDLRGGTGGAADVISTIPMPLNQWVHLVAVYDEAAGQMRLYINGTLDNTASRTGTIGVNELGVQIGANISTAGVVRRWLDGTIDEVAVYDYALAGERILAHYSAGIGLVPTEPAALHISMSDGLIVLDWTATEFRLQSAEDITTGNWNDVPDAVPPFTVTPVESRQFYRLVE